MICSELWIEIERVQEQDPCIEKVVKTRNEEYDNVFEWVLDILDHKSYIVGLLNLFFVEVDEWFEWVSLAFFQERFVELDTLSESDWCMMIVVNARENRMIVSTWSWLNGISREWHSRIVLCTSISSLLCCWSCFFSWLRLSSFVFIPSSSLFNEFSSSVNWLSTSCCLWMFFLSVSHSITSCVCFISSLCFSSSSILSCQFSNSVVIFWYSSSSSSFSIINPIHNVSPFLYWLTSIIFNCFLLLVNSFCLVCCVFSISLTYVIYQVWHNLLLICDSCLNVF